MMLGMPRDFDELVRQYGGVIKRIAPRNSLLVAHHLWYRGVLGGYRAPPVLSRDEVIAFLGLSEGTWKVASRDRPHLLPPPLEGTLFSKASTYRMATARTTFEQRSSSFPGVNRLGFFESRLPGLEGFILTQAIKIVEELKFGYIFDVPSYLPHNDKELMDQYSVAIARLVRCRVKFGVDTEDAINDIWVKLLAANILVKFMRAWPKRISIQLGTDETLDFLGVEWSQWQHMRQHYDKAPNPAKGAASSDTAVYYTQDICNLDQSGYFKKRGIRFLPPNCVTKKAFDSYLMRAAKHNLANLFRTLDRRFNKEDTLAEGACIHDNSHVRMQRREDRSVPWEETVVSMDASAEFLVDAKRIMEAQTTLNY